MMCPAFFWYANLSVHSCQCLGIWSGRKIVVCEDDDVIFMDVSTHSLWYTKVITSIEWRIDFLLPPPSLRFPHLILPTKSKQVVLSHIKSKLMLMGKRLSAEHSASQNPIVFTFHPPTCGLPSLGWENRQEYIISAQHSPSYIARREVWTSQDPIKGFLMSAMKTQPSIIPSILWKNYAVQTNNIYPLHTNIPSMGMRMNLRWHHLIYIAIKSIMTMSTRGLVKRGLGPGIDWTMRQLNHMEHWAFYYLNT